MGLFSIIHTITNIAINQYVHIAHTEERAHTFHKREVSHTFPVLYESHTPLVMCYDTRSETKTIDATEIAEYADLLNASVNDHIPLYQSIVLYDTLSVEYMSQTIYVSHARSKDFVYRGLSAAACKLNENRIKRHKVHSSSAIIHTDNYTLHDYLDNNTSFVMSSVLVMPVDILNILRGMLGNDSFTQKNVSDILHRLQNVSLVFNVHDYEVKVRNINAIFFNAQRVLTKNRRVRAMCVNIDFDHISHDQDKENTYTVEYTNMYNDTLHYIHNTHRGIYAKPPIFAHDGLINIVNVNCSQNTFDTQNNTLTTQKTTAPHNNDNSVAVLSLLSLVVTVAGVVIMSVLFKAVKYCVRKCVGTIPLTQHHDNNTHCVIEMTETEIAAFEKAETEKARIEKLKAEIIEITELQALV